VLDDSTGKYEYTLVHGEESLDFEWAALMISLLAFSQYQFMRFSIRKLRLKKYRQEVILLQNFELSMMYAAKDEAAKQGDETTTVELTKAQREQQELDALMQRNYRREMAELSRRFPKNFLDCRWFQSKSDAFFIATMVCQLIQSMGYNGLYDIPSLLMILGLFAFYTLRKSNPHGYLLFLFVSIYYISLAILVKWLYLILIRITWVENYADANRESTTVFLAQALFGRMGVGKLGRVHRGQSDTKKAEGISFQLSIIGTFYFSMVYQSAKWCRIREHTQILSENTGFWTRLKFYVKYRDRIATKDQRVEKILQHSREQIGGSNLLAQ
jgi:hypothetical protein